jgi:hypothetical protein
MKFAISLFQNVGVSRPEPMACSWEQLCKVFSTPKVRAEKDGQLFSPARYARPRRLAANVVELSLLVLEIDGAWKCARCGYAAPLVRFRNAKLERDRCMQCKKAKVPEPHTITQIEFHIGDVIAEARRIFGSAFAVYSTHSHKQTTASNPLAEPRYRIVVPLIEPVPISHFSELWRWATGQMVAVPADPQDKDPNRIFYTPVKCAADAPYEFYIEPGGLFDWRVAILGLPSSQPAAVKPRSTGGDPGAREDAEKPSPVLTEPNHNPNGPLLSAPSRGPVQAEGVADRRDDQFLTFELRHEELARRIMARGKQNARGHWDARCIAHGGKGNSGMAYFPESGVVQCNAGCSYYELVKAEGLPDTPLPSRDRLAVEQARTVRVTAAQRTKPLTVAQLHLVYALLLSHFFELSAEHEALIQKHWPDAPIYGAELVPWLGPEERPDRPVKMCSMPNGVQKAFAANTLSQWIDLTGVPGFFREVLTTQPASPSPALSLARWLTKEFGPWRLNLTSRSGLLVPYYNDEGFILGIRIHKTTKDRYPMLLTSRGLPGGAAALAYREAVAA